MNDCLVVYIEKDVALIMKLLCNDFKISKLIEGNCKFYVFAYFFNCCCQYIKFSFY